MAYGFGTTVNPQLGATNYSGFLQGALTGAQMQAQGGAAIAQGLASAGKSIGAGITQERERKDKMAERDRLLKEQQNAMTGRVQQVNNLGNALSKIEGLPPELVGIFEDYKNVAGNPDVALSQQDAYAQSLLGQLPQVISLGLNEARRQKDVQNNKFLQEAIFMNTALGTGEVDIPNAARTAVELGAAPDFVTQQLQGFEKLSPETFTPEIKTLTDPESGRKVQVVTTSRGGAQVIPETAGLRIPAEVVANDDRIKKLSEARKLYEAGKTGEALDIFIGLDVKNNFGQTPSIEDLAGFYKGISAPSNPGAPSPQGGGTKPDELVNFATEAEAEDANLPAGTKFTIGPEKRLAVATGASPSLPPVEDAVEKAEIPRVPLTKEERAARNQRNREMLTGFVGGLPDFASRVAGGFSQTLQDFVTSTNDSEETVAFLRSLAQKPGSGRMQKESLLKQAKSMELRIERKRNKQAGK